VAPFSSGRIILFFGAKITIPWQGMRYAFEHWNLH